MDRQNLEPVQDDVPAEHDETSAHGSRRRGCEVPDRDAFRGEKRVHLALSQRRTCYREGVTDLPLFPLPELVVFPGMTLPLYIFEERYRKMVRECVESNERRIVLTLAQPSPQISDSTELQGIVYVGSYVDILSVMENADGSFHILTHGQGRCHVRPSRSEAVSAADGAVSYLHYTQDEPYPLGRSDPNSERLAAWDALEVFYSYAERFFADTARDQLEEALPDDLLFQASFICANMRLAAPARQTLLEAPTLIDRFTTAEGLMRKQLESDPQPSETTG